MNNKRRFESKSIEDIQQALMKKQARKLDRLTITTSFEKFFEANKKKYMPNLLTARTRSSSTDLLTDSDSGKQKYTGTSSDIKKT